MTIVINVMLSNKITFVMATPQNTTDWNYWNYCDIHQTSNTSIQHQGDQNLCYFRRLRLKRFKKLYGRQGHKYENLLCWWM